MVSREKVAELVPQLRVVERKLGRAFMSERRSRIKQIVCLSQQEV
jgi:hypothetical protein